MPAWAARCGVWLCWLHWAAAQGSSSDQGVVVLRSSARAPAGSPVVVGASLPLDCCSAFASYGRLTLQSWQLFINWLGDRGGLSVGGVRRPLEIRIASDQSKAALVTAAYAQHIRDGVQLLLGPYSSNLSSRAAAVANASGAVLVCPTASDTEVSRGRPTVFSTLPPATRFMTGAFEALVANRARTVAFVSDSSGSQISKCAPIAAYASAHGMNLTYSRVVPPNASKEVVAATVAELKLAAPDAVFGCLQIPGCQDFADEMLATDVSPGAFVMSICVTLPAWAARGESGLFFTGTTPWLSSMPLQSALTGVTAEGFARLYQAQFDTDPPYQAATAFAAVEVLAVAIEQAGSADPAAVARQLRAIRLDTVYGTVTFDANGQADLDVRAVQPVKLNSPPPTVSPLAAAQAAMAYPMPDMAHRGCMSTRPSIFGYSAGRCSKCPTGFASIWDEATASRVCFFCPPGFLYKADSAECARCPPGKISITALQDQCTNCTPGTYAAAADQSECTGCPVGAFASSPGATSCQLCPAGAYNGEVRQSQCIRCLPGSSSNAAGGLMCQACEVGRYADGMGMEDCTPCSGGRVTAEAGSRSSDACACAKDFYFEGGRCVRCPPLHNTEAFGATSRGDCVITDTGRAMIGALVVSAVVTPCLIWAVWARMKMRLERMEHLQLLTLQQQLNNGLQTTTEFQHPMVVVPAADLLRMTDADLQGAHEEARERGLLKTFDCVSQVSEYRVAHPSCRMVLFSYEWLSWVHKGPSSEQAAWMRRALDLYCQWMRIPAEEAFVWLDVLSIPQISKGVQVLAVNSLYTYASAVDALIIIAPPCIHEGTGEKANLETYKKRVWTRVEQVAHVAAHGLDSLYIATERGLQTATSAWIEEVTDIFSGNMTCCRLKHKSRKSCDKESLVLPLLGLWYRLCGGSGPPANSGAALLHRLIQPRISEIFPATFAFETEDQVEQRPLFGTLIPLLEKHLRRQRSLEQPRPPPSWAQEDTPPPPIESPAACGPPSGCWGGDVEGPVEEEAAVRWPPQDSATLPWPPWRAESL